MRNPKTYIKNPVIKLRGFGPDGKPGSDIKNYKQKPAGLPDYDSGEYLEENEGETGNYQMGDYS